MSPSMRTLFCSEVDKLSNFQSKHQIQQSTLNRIFKILRHQEKMILSSKMYDKTYLQGSLEGVLEMIQVSSLLRYLHGLWMVGSPFQISSLREKEKKGENFHKACMSTFSCGHSPPIYRNLVSEFFIKTLIIMYISTNIHRPYT